MTIYLLLLLVLSAKEDYIDNLSVAENTNITKEFIDNVYLFLQDIFRDLGTNLRINSIRSIKMEGLRIRSSKNPINFRKRPSRYSFNKK